ncbi:hypothetical protein Pcinc_040580 [Petrolisthes cinctipes]|uniref:Uncharacterized protein n=1 Tax=Petrolisthes cinctipes TaxID=88211 RepID=A0AAE1BPC5_PETCI|nr:hypothetical protein Pcinc_040580 [Petrolisthes cinctipes]
MVVIILLTCPEWHGGETTQLHHGPIDSCITQTAGTELEVIEFFPSFIQLNPLCVFRCHCLPFNLHRMELDPVFGHQRDERLQIL